MNRYIDDADPDHPRRSAGQEEDERTSSDRVRSITLTLRCPHAAVHPVDRVLAEQSDVTRETLLYVDAFVDGSGVLVYRLSGDSSALDDALAEREDVLAHEVVDDSDDAFGLYLHVGPGEPAGTLVGLLSTHRLLVDLPIVFTATGRVQVTVIGPHAEVRTAVQHLPAGVEYSVERVVSFAADSNGVLTGLTDRQLEVMRAAVEVGYYDVPKRGDREDIAAALDLSPSTIGRHLQKAERHIVTRLLERDS
ncbi:helix-turn-helix domain-containing protein [Halomarina salina]|uniref:Helix-turn-helix domain-containing protein n=1 Tax=Halomarina salina TaxID=1872699 RepID=A0ABD5RMR2_9EURY